MALLHSNLREFCGKVIDIMPLYKAIVQFELDKKTERALLKYERLTINGQPLPEGGSIDDYVHIGTKLKFLCHNFDESKSDRCGWYITSAWLHEAREVDLKQNDTVLNGLYNCTGQVAEVARRQGVLTCINNGHEENVIFLGSKLFMSGKRVPVKTCLNQLPWLEEGRTLLFDAVPCDPSDNASSCKWFATVVWKGRKPVMEYDDVRSVRNKQMSEIKSIAEIKLITSNPHSLFLRTEGKVIKILSPEYGLAIGAVKNNQWESVLFHRSHVTLFDKSLANEDLSLIFKKGDTLRLVAASAPKKMVVRWVASQVRVLVDPSVSHRFQF